MSSVLAQTLNSIQHYREIMPKLPGGGYHYIQRTKIARILRASRGLPLDEALDTVFDMGILELERRASQGPSREATRLELQREARRVAGEDFPRPSNAQPV